MQLKLPPFNIYVPGQGGHFAAIMRGADPQTHAALLVTDRKFEVPEIIWGEYGKKIKGADSRTDGAANTAAMVKAKCPVALAIAQLEIDGHKDWIVPALGQLNAAAANAPEQFDPKGVVWTSTQGSANYAVVQDFAFGNSRWGGKGSKFRGRAFRTIPLDLLITSTL